MPLKRQIFWHHGHYLSTQHKYLQRCNHDQQLLGPPLTTILSIIIISVISLWSWTWNVWAISSTSALWKSKLLLLFNYRFQMNSFWKPYVNRLQGTKNSSTRVMDNTASSRTTKAKQMSNTPVFWWSCKNHSVTTSLCSVLIDFLNCVDCRAMTGSSTSPI
jgi:hypothetical protein